MQKRLSRKVNVSVIAGNDHYGKNGYLEAGIGIVLYRRTVVVSLENYQSMVQFL